MKLPIEHASKIGDINMVVARIMQEIVTPMKELGIEFLEYVALKAILFFNPYNTNCTDSESAYSLKNARKLALRTLRMQNKNNQLLDNVFEDRYGQLLLLLPAIQAIATALVEDVQLCRLFQLTDVDELIQELILHDSEKAGEQTLEEKLSTTSTPSLASPCVTSPNNTNSPGLSI
uniref:NR LBD domain-containing protein n=1 Tax=Acrobeloides nanus TaxID=290746 RepID=A0A914CV59_9BILA